MPPTFVSKGNQELALPANLQNLPVKTGKKCQFCDGDMVRSQSTGMPVCEDCGRCVDCIQAYC